MNVCRGIEMTRWKEGETEFTVKLSDDGRHSTICRIPRPIVEFLDNPESVTFVIKNKKIELIGLERSDRLY